MDIQELKTLLTEVEAEHEGEEPLPDYTKGFVDALVYIIDWMEEDE